MTGRNDNIEPFTSVAPGRLCLFGEHQDYLGLPVIALALPLCCSIRVTPIAKSTVLTLTFQNKIWSVDMNQLPPRQNSNDDMQDFALAAVHEVVEAGWDIQCGAECVSQTDIPLQSGCSSSSAFCISWVQVLAKLSNVAIAPMELAQMAHRAEVLHFGAPGGTMDHVTSAIGGILRIGPGMWDYEQLDQPNEGVWVLADSGQPKDTLGHLKRCKFDRLALFERLGENWNNDCTTLSAYETRLLETTRTNLQMEQQAASEWNLASGMTLGGCMDRHHCALRDGLELSTPRLERMREAALQSGAWGFKVVGSGGGGCGVAWSSNDCAVEVGKAMESAGSIKTWIVRTAFPGAHIVA